MNTKVIDFIKKYHFLILLSLGVILRLVWIFIMDTYPYTDFMWYHVKGVELSEGKGFLNGIYPHYIGNPGFPTAFRPIGYPGTLAILYYFFGTSFMVGKIFNVLLSTLIMFLTYKLALKFFNEKVAFITLLIFVFSPLAICYNSILGSEILFSAVLMLSIYLFFVKNNPILVGLLIGYLTLIRPIGMFIPAIFAIFIFIKKDMLLKQKFKYMIIFGIFFGLVVSPWLIRNYKAFGEPVFSTNGGYVIYVNNNDYATGSWSDPYKYPDSPFLQYRTDKWFDEMAIHNTGKELAIEWIKENPKQFINLGFLRLKNSYWAKTDEIKWAFTTGINEWHPMASRFVKLQKLLFRPFYIVLFAFILYSIFRFIRYRKIDFITFILLIFMYFTAMMFVLEGNSRYVFPLHPIYTIAVAFVLFNVFGVIRKKVSSFSQR
ncbi:glycosyltransferase family 39 protein [Herbivorax sp. ANBcel31]|uniref:ArnT family glycosyltransferase n=1 Tax=Herbivorax sp. ANBcel31 TaxID=3069754 RepID=UPI0027B22845|nr:glycosyltransferase family 39 protein [Herbivorax sp. ANBcel31]MDQ2085280.1 glycosyltransferase family 39 protein [Herbivorax sp. ANBcel31]